MNEIIKINVFITDMRTGCIRTYSMPYITHDGIVKAISGEMSILLNSFICSPTRNLRTR